MSDREMYLGALAGEYEGELPPPSTRSLKWMAKLLGQDVETEPVQSPEEAYLKEIAESGGGGGITPSGSVTITANGTHDVTEYAEAVVDVPNTYTASDVGKVVQAAGGGGSGTRYSLQTQRATTKTGVGTYTTTYNNSVTFQLAALSNAAGASDIAEGKTAYGADGAVITGTGSGGGNPNSVVTVTGTLANPFGSYSASALTAAVYNNEATMVLRFTDTAIRSAEIVMVSHPTAATTPMFVFAQMVNNNIIGAGSIRYKANGEIVPGQSRFAAQVSGEEAATVYAYDTTVETTLTIVFHPLPEPEPETP